MNDIDLMYETSPALETFVGVMFFVFIIGLILFSVGLFGVFRKKELAGWKAFIPMYNLWLMLELVGLHGWLVLIPAVNVYVICYALFKLSKSFGKSTIFSVLLALLFPPIFVLILGFSKEESEAPQSSYEDYSYNRVKDKSENIEVPSLSDQIKESEKIKDEPLPNIIEDVSPDPLRGDYVTNERVSPDPLKSNYVTNEKVSPAPLEGTYVNPVAAKEEPKEPVIESAFNMSLPKEEIEKAASEKTETLDIESSDIETLEIENNDFVNLNKTQKFCPSCGNPNDVLNKFCISCGYNFES